MNKPDDSKIPEEFRRERGGKRQSQQELRADRLRSQEVFLKTYAITGNITKSSKQAGINPETYYAWIRDEEFKARVATAREDCIGSADSELLRRGLDPKAGDTRALVSWLRAHDPAMYGDKTKIQLVGNEDMIRQIAEVIAANVTDPDLYARLREELRRIATT